MHPGRSEDATLQLNTTEACNVRYYHTTSLHTTTSHPDNYIVVKLQIEQELLLRFLTSGQLLHFTRNYISYMLSIQTTHYLPISQHSQPIYKVEYDMSRFTEIYSLKNNYIWNYHMPLLLPELLHYFNHHDQLHDFQYKAITHNQKCCSEVRSVAHECCSEVSIRSVAQSVAQKSHRSVD